MSVLKIHVTYQCTAACSHCRFRCTTRAAPAIDYDLAMYCVNALLSHNRLNLVVLMGGEPGLFPDLLLKLTQSIRRLDVAVRIETNAFWASSLHAAKAFLEPLYSAGASVMFSLDSFHEPFITVEKVENAIRASDELNGEYLLAVSYLDIKNRRDRADIRTEEMLAQLEKRLGRSPCCHIYQGNLFFNGRSIERLALRAAPGKGVPLEKCSEVPWWAKGSLQDFELLILDPEGYLSKGCGIAIANINDCPVKEILNTYDPKAHPILSTLLESGPLGLAKEATELGYELRESYADRCHLCQEAREVLRNRYPEYLVPAQHYR